MNPTPTPATGPHGSAAPAATAQAAPPPQISVVVATRDRPQLFAEAMDSVLAQQGVLLELVVVNDGSRDDLLPAYEPAWARARAQLGTRFTVHTLRHRPRGHGQSYSFNVGVSLARAAHVTFLDDDDRWTDPQHLARACAAIDAARQSGGALDLYMANQDAWNADGQRLGTLWLGPLAGQLQARGRQPGADGCYALQIDDLLAAEGFCHLNCLVVRRALFEQVGGMDEGIRWECDRDLFLKLIEPARVIVHHPAVVAYHRVPDTRKTQNMTTALSMVDKRLLQSLVMDRTLLRARHAGLRRYARRHKGYALKWLATELAARGDWRGAAVYALQALGVAPTPGWAAYALGYALRALVAGPGASSAAAGLSAAASPALTSAVSPAGPAPDAPAAPGPDAPRAPH